MEIGLDEIQKFLHKKLQKYTNTILFRLIYSFGHRSPITIGVDVATAENDNFFRDIVQPSQNVFLRHFPSANTSSNIPKSVLEKPNTDHGIESAQILQMCKEIADANCNGAPALIESINSQYQSLWPLYDEQKEAIALHDKSRTIIHDNAGSFSGVNPWAPFCIC